MSRLPAVFKSDGTVTAGNASGVTDASAAVVLMSKKKADEMGIEPFVTIKSYASGGIDPAYMGVGVVPAVRKVLEKENLTIKDLDVIEINEAFAAQTIAVLKELNLPMYGASIGEAGGEKINPNGGGISLGHPIGCTGARITVSIMHNMKKNNLHRGLITMCIGGGQGMAMIVER
jgi:acetyl-CoA C-acetyltransferase